MIFIQFRILFYFWVVFRYRAKCYTKLYRGKISFEKNQKEKFIKKDAIIIDLIIQTEINSIIELNESDW